MLTTFKDQASIQDYCLRSLEVAIQIYDRREKYVGGRHKSREAIGIGSPIHKHKKVITKHMTVITYKADPW